ncbi:hypothetical protein I3760_13G003100 [Carya illinoinensis]|nr:hypothetical protein I3760_13G003100 [Carya illinoinensis]
MGTPMTFFDERDTAPMLTRRNLFGPSEVDLTHPVQLQQVLDHSVEFNNIGTTQPHPILSSQESIFFDWMDHNRSSLGGDGSQEFD